MKDIRQHLIKKFLNYHMNNELELENPAIRVHGEEHGKEYCFNFAVYRHEHSTIALIDECTRGKEGAHHKVHAHISSPNNSSAIFVTSYMTKQGYKLSRGKKK